MATPSETEGRVDRSDAGLRQSLIREIVRADFQLQHPDVVEAVRACISGSTDEACSHLWRDVLHDIVDAIEDDAVELELFIRTISLLGLVSRGSRPQLLQRFA